MSARVPLEPGAAGLGEMPPLASLHGGRIDALMHLTHVFDGVFVVLLTIFAAYALWRFRKVRHPVARYERGESPRVAILTVGLVLFLFAIVEGNVFINSVIDLDEVFWAPPPEDLSPLRVQVNAQQWSWSMRQAGADGHFGTADDVLELDELTVPVDRPIAVQLASSDVIHSLFLPHFRVKMDAVPGMVNHFWFYPIRTGRFEIACTEHCGANHYKMRAILNVLEQDAYAAWAKEASEQGRRAFDAADPAATWAWSWERP